MPKLRRQDTVITEYSCGKIAKRAMILSFLYPHPLLLSNEEVESLSPPPEFELVL